MTPRVTGPGIAVVLLLDLGFLPGCAATHPSLPATGHGATRPLWLVTPGWHSGLAVRTDDIPMDLMPEQADFKGARYLEFGWGDRDYYRSPESDPWLAVKAAAIPGPAVLHVAGFSEPPSVYFGPAAVLRIDLPAPAQRRLIGYLHSSFQRRGEIRAPSLGPGWYGNSRFYPAEGRFHLFHNCNVWAAEALQTAGLPLLPALAITAQGLRCQMAHWEASNRSGHTEPPPSARHFAP